MHYYYYYGYYSNKSRGMRKKSETDDEIPTVMPGEISSAQFKRNWARLIKKVYEIDPFIMSQMSGKHENNKLY